MIRQRIGKHAKPGGIVVHIVAYPTGRLLDVMDASPDDESFDRDAVVLRDVELRDGETGLAMLPYDGDTGKLIRPPRPLTKFIVSYPVAVVAVVVNLAILVALLSTVGNPGYRFGASVVNGLSLGLASGCLVIQRGRRRRARAAYSERRLRVQCALALCRSARTRLSAGSLFISTQSLDCRLLHVGRLGGFLSPVEVVDADHA